MRPLPVWFDRCLHLCGMLLILYLTTFFKKGKPAENPLVRLLERIIPLVVSVLLVYLMINGNDIILRNGKSSVMDVVCCWLLIVLIVEGVRRMVGIPLTIITLVFIAYLFVGPFIPGALRIPLYSKELITSLMFNSLSGLFSSPIGISATFIVMFIMFGSFLLKSGAGDFFSDLANAIAGRLIGGAAKTAVLSSALFGMINGSPAANAATTGVFTIPLMKRTGYAPEFAAAVEATASTGGMFLPPIMGASAFLMAEMCQIPYVHIAIMAAIPAIIYYLIVYSNVHLEAQVLKLPMLPVEELPKIKDTLKKGFHYLFTLFVLVYTLAIGWSPSRVGFCAILCLVVLSWVRKETRMKPKDIVEAIKDGILATRVVAMACAAAGIMMGVLSITGLGLKLSAFILSLSQGMLLLTLVLTALACIVLGMGTVSVSSYIIVATICAPALMDLGVPKVMSHLFVYYFAMLAGLTPPVAVVSYITAGIANGDQNKTCFTALSLGMAAYIVPFLFIYNNKFLFGVDWPILTVCYYAASVFLGLFSITVFMRKYLFIRLGLVQRITFLVVAAIIIFGITLNSLLLLNGGLLAFAVMFFSLLIKQRAKTKAALAQ